MIKKPKSNTVTPVQTERNQVTKDTPKAKKAISKMLQLRSAYYSATNKMFELFKPDIARLQTECRFDEAIKYICENVPECAAKVLAINTTLILQKAANQPTVNAPSPKARNSPTTADPTLVQEEFGKPKLDKTE